MKELFCRHCEHKWKYRGNSKFYATCPKCHYLVRIAGVKKKANTVLVLSLTILMGCLLFAQNSEAGIVTFSNDVHLEPFSSVERCDYGLYATSKLNGTYSLNFSDNLQPFIKSITPTSVGLLSIDFYDAPQDPSSRKTFVYDACQKRKELICQMVCVEFQGLGFKNISWDLSGSTEQKVVGQIFSVTKISQLTGKEVLEFDVYYTSFDGKIIIGLIVLVVVVILLIVIFYVRRRKKANLPKAEPPQIDIPKNEEKGEIQSPPNLAGCSSNC